MDELNVLPSVDWQLRSDIRPNWGKKIGPKDVVAWRTDSDFAQDTVPEIGHGLRTRTQRVPNIHAMSERQFQEFIADVRTRRKEFKQFMLERGIIKDGKQSLYELAQKRNSAPAEFMTYLAAKQQAAKGTLQPSPHRVGGLQYRHPSPLQTYLDTKPQPGRILQKTTSPSLTDAWTVGFAGMTPVVSAKSMPIGQVQPITFSEEEGPNSEGSVHNFRFEPTQFMLASAPNVVGTNWQDRQATGVPGVQFAATVVSSSVVDEKRSNTYRPGSREYISSIAPVSYADEANGQRYQPGRASGLQTTRNAFQNNLQSRIQQGRTKNQTLNDLRDILTL